MREFSEVYEEYLPDIKVIALGQRVPGLDHDDVVAEMATCLWKAWGTWDDTKGAFGSYWWSVWLNRRSDLTQAAFRDKRPRLVLTDEVRGTGYTMGGWPEAPEGSDLVAQNVWNLLASGEPVKEVIHRTGVSRRRYYDLIRSWRSEEVRSILRS